MHPQDSLTSLTRLTHKTHPRDPPTRLTYPTLKTHTVVVSLNNLQEKGGPVLHRLSEDLQQVAIVIVVH
jgi:hypothetical protein